MEYQEVFAKLRATTSRIDKIKILKNAGVLTQEILKYAYDPFKHYYINKTKKVKTGTLYYAFTDSAWCNLLDKLANRSVSGDIGKQAVQLLINSMPREDAELFQMILKKDLRCGISAKTINAAIPGLIPEFGTMLAKKWDESRYEKGLLMSLKLDGVRAIFKDGTLYTRNGHKIQGVEHITDVIPSDWSFDGELMIPGMHFQESSGRIRSDNPTPDAVYNVFDIPDSTMELHRRLALVSAVVPQVGDPHVQFIKHIKCRDLQHINDTFIKALEAGYEGLVIKTPNHKYQIKRNWDWMKLKNQRDEDLPVVGFYEGKGKCAGTLGGIIVERKNSCHVRVGSGFGDEERANIWNDKESFLGKTVQVNYHEETPDGSLRHPIFAGFRWDKD